MINCLCGKCRAVGSRLDSFSNRRRQTKRALSSHLSIKQLDQQNDQGRDNVLSVIDFPFSVRRSALCLRSDTLDDGACETRLASPRGTARDLARGLRFISGAARSRAVRHRATPTRDQLHGIPINLRALAARLENFIVRLARSRVFSNA
jgi:hypothetical protein